MPLQSSRASPGLYCGSHKSTANFAGCTSTATGRVFPSSIIQRFARGTAAAMTPVQSGDELGRLTFIGCAVAGGFTTAGTTNNTLIRCLATENWATAAQGSKLEIWTVTAATATGALRATFDPNFTITGVGFQPGGGSWTATSDQRVKKDVEPYTRGLEAVRKLEPIRYRYNGLTGILDTETVYHGLAAEDAREVMPEMVSTLLQKLREDDEDEVEVLHVNSTALVFALVNAVKEL